MSDVIDLGLRRRRNEYRPPSVIMRMVDGKEVEYVNSDNEAVPQPKGCGTVSSFTQPTDRR